MRRVLLTRSVEENSIIREKLSIKNVESVLLDLLQFKILDYDFSKIRNKNHIIITSKLAAKILPSSEVITSKIIVVGEKSAAILRGKGLIVEYVAKNVNDLLIYIDDIDLAGTIYLCSNVITKHIPNVESAEIYHTIYRTKLNQDEYDSIKKGIDVIPIYSENCAKTLVKLLKQNDLLKFVENARIIAISLKVSMVLHPYFKDIRVATSPDRLNDEVLCYV